MKKQLLILFAFISVLALSQVPQRFNKVVVTGDIASPKFIKTGSNADSVLLGNGSARAISTIKTDTVNLSNRINAKATGNGTANGTNTGDETLTSIKTKLGAATSVSDGYLKYQDWSTFNSKEPAITKNTAFNKNFGTTTGTVLEGRTFGTAAGSAVGDFQPTITGLTTNNLVKWNGSNFVNSLISDNGSRSNTDSPIILRNGTSDVAFIGTSFAAFGGAASASDGATYIYGANKYHIATNNIIRLSISGAGDASVLSTTPSTSPTTGALVVSGGVGADHVRANQFYGNGSNLTGIQLPITLTTNGTSGAATFSGNVLNVPNYASTGTGGEFTSNYTNISNTTLSTSTLAAYTNINGIINASVFGAVTSTASGKCTFRLSVPTVIRSGRCAVVSGVESGKTTSANIFIEGTGSTYVDISFIASTSSSILEFKMITMGY